MFRQFTCSLIAVALTVGVAFAQDKKAGKERISQGTFVSYKVGKEDTLMAAKCPSYDKLRSGYCGTKDGTDFRLVIYNANFR